MSVLSLEDIERTLDLSECILRASMPQVDEADIPALIDFLAGRGVDHQRIEVDPRTLRGFQRVVPSKVKGIIRTNLGLLKKPALVSADRGIVDGNHRIAAAKIIRQPVPILSFNREFARLIEDVYAFPKTYEYGDGNAHPVTN